ncbi:MAG: hypothetical protein MZU95_09905 [Desulfomicrobium escambiense]|nr:hypothetical protein [Desulfomicrobium escambiense]
MPELLKHFAEYFAHELGMKPKEFDAEAMRILCGYDWPGNIRELKNVVERLMIMGPSKTIAKGDIEEQRMLAVPPYRQRIRLFHLQNAEGRP